MSPPLAKTLYPTLTRVDGLGFGVLRVGSRFGCSASGLESGRTILDGNGNRHDMGVSENGGP